MKNVFAWICLSALLVSCEGNTRLEWSLENQTSGYLYVIHDDSDYQWYDTLTAAPGEVLLLGQNDILGGRELPFDPFSFIDTLWIYNEQGHLTTKDWQETLNWEIESFHDRNIPSQWRHTYLITLAESDF